MRNPKKRRAKRKTTLEINHGIDLDLWQRRPHYVEWAQRFLSSKMGSEMLSVLKNQRPVGRQGSLSPTDAAVELGRLQGYMDAVNTLTALSAAAPGPIEDIPIDYNVDDELRKLDIEPEED